jgi:hypothetical protein
LNELLLMNPFKAITSRYSNELEYLNVNPKKYCYGVTS